MKTTYLKTLFGSLLIASAFVATPIAAFAANGTTTASVRINGDGIVHVINAEVTSISGNLINAVTRFKNNVLTWAFTTNASTTITSRGSGTASTADIRIGDKLNVTGPVTALGSTISVTATGVRDLTSLATTTFRVKTGTVQSVNTSNGTFVMKSGDNKLVTIQTNSSTTFKLFAAATSTTSTLASVPLNSKVTVTGTANSDGTIITASKVSVLASAEIAKSRKELHDKIKLLRKDWKDTWKDHRKDNR